MSVTPAMEGGPPVRKEFLTFFKICLHEDEIKEVVETLRSGWLTTGPKVTRFETMFREYQGVSHAIGLNSCTAGLFIALKLASLKPGTEVITTPFTFAASANVIMQCDCVPVFVDIERDTLNLDPELVDAAVTGKTGAILPVHLFGRPCNMEALSTIAEKNNLTIISDAAHAIETEWNGSKIGALSDFTAYSFYATKNVITGEGGMLTFSRDQWLDRALQLRLHGMSRDAWKRYSKEGAPVYDIVEAGYKYNMTDVQAALGIHQLQTIETRWHKREQMFQVYSAKLDGLPLTLPSPPAPATRHAYHIFNILLDLDHLKKSRNEIVAAFHEENIGTGIHFPALHLTSFYSKHFGWKKGDFPNAEWVAERTVSLPFSPYMDDTDIMDVVEACRRILIYYKK